MAIFKNNHLSLKGMVYLVSVVMDNSSYTTIKATREEAEKHADEVREKARVVTITPST